MKKNASIRKIPVGHNYDPSIRKYDWVGSLTRLLDVDFTHEKYTNLPIAHLPTYLLHSTCD